MAKGLRASSRKKNNQALRARLYDPAAEARAERLSAKLQELAAKPRPDQERVMEVDEQPKSKTAPSSAPPESKDEEMQVDFEATSKKGGAKAARVQKAGRIQKKIARRRSKKSVVFPDLKAKWRRQAAEKQTR